MCAQTGKHLGKHASARMFLQLLPHLRGPLNGNSMTSKTLHDCVSLGYSSRLKHFSLFRSAKFGVRVKNERRGELEGESVKGALSRIVGFAGKRFLFSLPPPLLRPTPSFQKAKNSSKVRKTYGNDCYAGYSTGYRDLSIA